MNSMPECELETMGFVLTALQKLEADAQVRVLKWVAEKLELSSIVQMGISAPRRLGSSDAAGAISGAAPYLPAASSAWIKQNSMTAGELELVFHIEDADMALIAAEIPGKSTREKVLNCYVLAGVRELLRTGDASFSDKSARALCGEFGCLDTTNHSKYLNERGIELTGSKEKGWMLTAPGKKRGAALVKEIASCLA